MVDSLTLLNDDERDKEIERLNGDINSVEQWLKDNNLWHESNPQKIKDVADDFNMPELSDKSQQLLSEIYNEMSKRDAERTAQQVFHPVQQMLF